MALTHRILLRSLVLAALTAVLTACGGAQERYASHLERGKTYLAQGNLDKASVEFRNAAQIKPKDAESLYFAGRVAESRQSIREAVAYYQAALENDPNYEPARASLGKVFVFAGAPQRALDTVAPALARHPDQPDLLAVRAAAQHQLGQNEAARADAERAVQVSPTNENAVAALAALYADTKEYPRAIALVSGAVDRAPTSVDLREVLTNLYLVTEQEDKAREQMRKIIELQPMDLAPRIQFAQHLLRVHDLDAAERVLEEAVQAFSSRKQQANGDAAKLALVSFIAQQRSRAQGEKRLRDFIAQNPDNLDLRLGLGALLQRTGTPSQAIKAYQEVIERDGTGARGLNARDRIAAIQLSQGQAGEAGKSVAEVLQKNPRDDDALILRATIESQSNDPGAAISDLRAVLRDQPNSPLLLRQLAAAYVAKGDRALAEETLRAALQLAPNDVPVRIDLADLLIRTERTADGVKLLEETVARTPDSEPAREALIKAYLAKNDSKAAEASAEEFETQQPKSAVGFYYAGLIAAQDKRFEEAQKSLDRAMELKPQSLETLTALVKVEASRGLYDDAISKLHAAVESHPQNIQLLDLLGGLFLAKKDFTGAAAVFSREITQSPRLWQPHRNLAIAKLAANDPAGAGNEYQAALKLAPTEPLLVADAAVFYEKQGRVDEAIAGYETLYEGNPQSQQFAANNLAMLLVTHKTDRPSLDRARELTAKFAESDNSSLLDTLGWVRFKRGEFQEALPVLEKAFARAPESKVIRYHLGMDQLQLGQRQEARSNLESALAGSGSFPGAEDARLALASLKARSG